VGQPTITLAKLFAAKKIGRLCAMLFEYNIHISFEHLDNEKIAAILAVR